VIRFQLPPISALEYEALQKQTEWLIGRFRSEIEGPDQRRIVGIVYGLAYTIPGSSLTYLTTSTSGIEALQLELAMKIVMDNSRALYKKTGKLEAPPYWPWWKRFFFRLFIAW
jgi:hypothetical protein